MKSQTLIVLIALITLGFVAQAIADSTTTGLDLTNDNTSNDSAIATSITTATLADQTTDQAAAGMSSATMDQPAACDGDIEVYYVAIAADGSVSPADPTVIQEIHQAYPYTQEFTGWASGNCNGLGFSATNSTDNSSDIFGSVTSTAETSSNAGNGLDLTTTTSQDNSTLNGTGISGY